MRARIKENMHYVKDMNNFAILNTNKAAIKEHEKKMAELQRIKSTENDINTLKSEVSEIKSMLSQILKAVGGEK
jgi:ribosome-interacting GTPase 1